MADEKAFEQLVKMFNEKGWRIQNCGQIVDGTLWAVQVTAPLTGIKCVSSSRYYQGTTAALALQALLKGEFGGRIPSAPEAELTRNHWPEKYAKFENSLSRLNRAIERLL